ncbi:MAG: LysR substrate-binding domain-containing protein [Pseudomonadota bacterium]
MQESLTGIRMFERVIESGSFSEAARQLGVAPSSVSRQVSELEDALGVRLFQRSTRRLSLTEAGEIYHEHAARVLSDLDEARLAVSQLDGTPSGILRLSLPGSLSRRLIVPAVAAFQERYPAVEIALVVSDQVLDMIEHRIDVTLRLGALSDSNLVARKLSTAPRRLCASAHYLEKAGTPGTPEQLAQHNCLTFRTGPGSNLWTFYGNGEDTREIQARGRLYANGGESLVAAAVAGQGIILVPGWLVQDELDRGDLQLLLPDWSPVPAETPLYALYPLQRHLAPKVRAFIDFMVEWL